MVGGRVSCRWNPGIGCKLFRFLRVNFGMVLTFANVQSKTLVMLADNTDTFPTYNRDMEVKLFKILQVHPGVS